MLLNRGMDTETTEWEKTFTVEYYSAIKNNGFMKLLGKWMELENIILSEEKKKKKEHT